MPSAAGTGRRPLAPISVCGVNERVRPLIALAAIAAVEGLALVVYALFDVVEALRVGATGPAEVSNGPAIVVLILITGLFGAALLWVARGWWLARRWARAPFLLAQVIAVLIGFDLAQGASSLERWAGIALALIALVGIFLVFTPAVTRALDD